MFENEEQHGGESAGSPGPGHPVAGEDVGTPEEGSGRAKEEATPEIGEDANKGETAHPAPEDDVGVPEDVNTPKDEE